MHPQTRKSLSPTTGARPNKVELSLLRSDLEEMKWTIDMYGEDGLPHFLVHRLGPSEIDLAALSVKAELPDGVVNRPANRIATQKLALATGMDMFILGYPKSLHRFGLPVWKRASLAIDYAAAVDLPGHRHLLVDTASREGMSGAIVLARSTGGYMTENGDVTIGVDGNRIVGVYTGRVGSSDQLDAQIGMVWPMRYVEEIFRDCVSDPGDW